MKPLRADMYKLVLVLALMVALGMALAPRQAAAWGRGTFYVIGVGPAGPRTATLEALDTIKKMDVLIADDRHQKLFAEYIGQKPVDFDPWKGRWDYQGKPVNQLTAQEKAQYDQERWKVRERNLKRINQLLAQGKDVGLLDSGNPCLFGPAHWYLEHLAPADVVIIPGMGCDAAAMAVLKKSVIPAHGARFVLQSSPHFLFRAQEGEKDGDILRDLAKYEQTMVMYMFLRDPVAEFQRLGRYLPADTPVACVYWAGYAEKQRVVRGTVGDMGPKLAQDPERFMGLIFIGRFLEGQPYEGAIRRPKKPSNGKKDG